MSYMQAKVVDLVIRTETGKKFGFRLWDTTPLFDVFLDVENRTGVPTS